MNFLWKPNKTERHSEGVITTEESNPSRHPELVSGSLSESHNIVQSDEMLNTVQSLKNVSISLQHDNLSEITTSPTGSIGCEEVKPAMPVQHDRVSFAKRCAFTLAEVLITLSILGVVAAIAIPNIIQQYQKRLTITKLQKAYATLENAATNLAVNTGCVGRDFACTQLSSYTNDTLLNEKFFQLSNVNTKKINVGNNKKYKSINYDKQPANALRSVSSVWVDKNNIGYSIQNKLIYLTNSTTSGYVSGLSIMVFTNPSFNKYHNEEINGSKVILNNIKEGYNVFEFILYGNFIVEPNAGCWGGQKRPLSKSYVENDCSKNSDLNCYGTTCAARIIRDGWKINYW